MSFDYAQDYKQKGFASVIILVGLLVIAAVASGAYFLGKSNKVEPVKVVSQPQTTLQPTTVPQVFPTSASSPIPNGTGDMANWKTYTNNKFGYSIEYPADKVINCGTDEFLLDYNEDRKQGCNLSQGPAVPFFNITVNTSGFGFESISNDNCSSTTVRDITVAGIVGGKYVRTYKGGQECTSTGEPLPTTFTVVINYKNNKYFIFYYPINTVNLSQENQILSTFKFIN